MDTKLMRDGFRDVICGMQRAGKIGDETPEDKLHFAVQLLSCWMTTRKASTLRHAARQLLLAADAFDAAAPACCYCGATEGLRVLHGDAPLGVPLSLTCAECFSSLVIDPEDCGGAQVAPAFDDLEPAA